MSYKRVIPRDLFNEAKLLKCMGLLAVKVLDYMVPIKQKYLLIHDGESFNIEQDDSSGDLFISNVHFHVSRRNIPLSSRYNSKDNYTLYAEIDGEAVKVFDEKGEFSEEFIQAFKNDEK